MCMRMRFGLDVFFYVKYSVIFGSGIDEVVVKIVVNTVGGRGQFDIS